jgi:hypothetical protein
MNGYEYVGGNPVGYLDWRGLDAEAAEVNAGIEIKVIHGATAYYWARHGESWNLNRDRLQGAIDKNNARSNWSVKFTWAPSVQTNEAGWKIFKGGYDDGYTISVSGWEGIAPTVTGMLNKSSEERWKEAGDSPQEAVRPAKRYDGGKARCTECRWLYLRAVYNTKDNEMAKTLYSMRNSAASYIAGQAASTVVTTAASAASGNPIVGKAAGSATGVATKKIVGKWLHDQSEPAWKGTKGSMGLGILLCADGTRAYVLRNIPRWKTRKWDPTPGGKLNYGTASVSGPVVKWMKRDYAGTRWTGWHPASKNFLMPTE